MSNWTEERPTASLRFVERSIPVLDGPRTVRILQQAWDVKTFTGSIADSVKTEWRDVPLGVE